MTRRPQAAPAATAPHFNGREPTAPRASATPARARSHGSCRWCKHTDAPQAISAVLAQISNASIRRAVGPSRMKLFSLLDNCSSIPIPPRASTHGRCSCRRPFPESLPPAPTRDRVSPGLVKFAALVRSRCVDNSFLCFRCFLFRSLAS